MTRQIACPYCDDGIREYAVGLEVRVEPCPWCSGHGRLADRRAAPRDRTPARAVGYLLIGLSWIVGALLLALLIAHLAAAPRSAPESTTPVDMSGQRSTPALIGECDGWRFWIGSAKCPTCGRYLAKSEPVMEPLGGVSGVKGECRTHGAVTTNDFEIADDEAAP